MTATPKNFLKGCGSKIRRFTPMIPDIKLKIYQLNWHIMDFNSSVAMYLKYMHLQVGIETGFYTVKTAFSTPFSVQEGLEMVRRTGAKVIDPSLLHVTIKPIQLFQCGLN
jgi:hypothetical protein